MTIDFKFEISFINGATLFLKISSFSEMKKGRGVARIAPIVLEGRRGSISRPQGRKRVWHRRKHRSAIAESRSAAMG